MREQTFHRLKGQTGLLPGMLQRSKYSRLRNDSLTSLEEYPSQGALALKTDPCLTSDPTRCLGPLPPQVGPRTPPDHQGSSTLRGFIPRVANIRLHSPASLLGLRGQTDRHGDRSSSQTDWDSGSAHGLLIHKQPPEIKTLALPRTSCLPLNQTSSQTHSCLQLTQRPIALRRMASHPWTRGHLVSCLKGSASTDGHIPCLRENRMIHPHIKYMGSLEVIQSMRALDFNTRMQVTREAISRLCKKTPGTKTATPKSKRLLSKRLSAVLGQSNLQFSGTSILLTISTDSVVLTTANSLKMIAHHPMQSISFASGGDPDMADYVAYVAKDSINQRACHILECAPGQACEVINSIGQAFETRFQQLLSHTPSLLPTNHKCTTGVGVWSQERTDIREVRQLSQDHEYYNQIPGKAPPPGGIQDMRTSENQADDAGIKTVCSSQAVSMYENCSLTQEPLAPPAEVVLSERAAEALTQDLLQKEEWYHGRLGRAQAEKLLTCSGDFLVRESSSAPGQYVLSGMEGRTARHLLLVDPQGQVRTRDQVFLSVGHLVGFHMHSQTPIISGSSELSLRQPVLQRLCPPDTHPTHTHTDNGSDNMA
ncbi:SHC-transforming protein 4-like [Osmerus eperlanus]|uniref:SHC-transforming protein 4-like n=1 Tax=Osmerus eperlanus TaxID=29151 RepID=UPI002E0E858E